MMLMNRVVSAVKGGGLWRYKFGFILWREEDYDVTNTVFCCEGRKIVMLQNGFILWREEDFDVIKTVLFCEGRKVLLWIQFIWCLHPFCSCFLYAILQGCVGPEVWHGVCVPFLRWRYGPDVGADGMWQAPGALHKAPPSHSAQTSPTVWLLHSQQRQH